MDELMSKLAKKGKKLSPLEKKAKMDVVKELGSQAREMMGDKIKSLKKVTVASPSEEGLKMGLEKAEDLIEGNAPEAEMMEETMGSEEKEEYNEPMSEEEMMAMSPEELDDHIQKLQRIKEEKLKG